jgi:hypothetical protein
VCISEHIFTLRHCIARGARVVVRCEISQLITTNQRTFKNPVETHQESTLFHADVFRMHARVGLHAGLVACMPLCFSRKKKHNSIAIKNEFILSLVVSSLNDETLLRSPFWLERRCTASYPGSTAASAARASSAT